MDSTRIISTGKTTLQLAAAPQQWSDNLTRAGWPDQFFQALAAYNKRKQQSKEGEQKTLDYLHQQLEQLDTVEHSIYVWLSQDSLPRSEQLSMFQLLNQVQAEHKELIRTLVERDFPLWIRTVDNPQQRQRVDRVWESITQRGSDGVFRLSNLLGENPLPYGVRRDMQDDLFAFLARLLSRPMGQALLQRIHHKGLTEGKILLFSLPPGMKSMKSYMVGVGANASQSATTGQIRWQGGAIVQLNTDPTWQGGTIIAGPGSGAEVTFVPGLTDAAMMDFNEEGKLLPSPVFLGLGHELVHVAHYQAGSYVGLQKDTTTLPPEYLGDLEEFLTIPLQAVQVQRSQQSVRASILEAGTQQYATGTFLLGELMSMNKDIPTEVDLRLEHGLGIRYGHETIANPLLYPQATKESLPNEFINDTKDWAKRYFKLL